MKISCWPFGILWGHCGEIQEGGKEYGNIFLVSRINKLCPVGSRMHRLVCTQMSGTNTASLVFSPHSYMTHMQGYFPRRWTLTGHAGSEGFLPGFWVSILEYSSQDHVTLPRGPLTLAHNSMKFQREERDSRLYSFTWRPFSNPGAQDIWRGLKFMTITSPLFFFFVFTWNIYIIFMCRCDCAGNHGDG